MRVYPQSRALIALIFRATFCIDVTISCSIHVCVVVVVVVVFSQSTIL